MPVISISHVHTSDLLHPTEKSGSQKIKDILERYPLPPHWKPANREGHCGRLQSIFFKILCLCAYGQPRLDPIWGAIKLEEEGNGSAWREGQRRTCNQLSNLLVVAGLLLATAAVFITTPPPDPSKLDYTRRGPYLCICGAFGILIGNIIVTSVYLIVIDKIPASHTGNVFYSNTVHVYCTLITVAYPSMSLALATLLLAFGALTAAWAGKDPSFQFGSIILLVAPISIGVIFTIASKPIPKQTEGAEEAPEPAPE